MVPIAADKWLEQVTRVLDTLVIEEGDLRVRFASFQLRGDIRQWWKAVKAKVGASWANFREIFLERYNLETAKDSMRDEFMHLIQDMLTVDQYEARFTHLARFVLDLVSTEDKECRRFEQGLHQSILRRVVVLRHQTFSVLLDAARRLERADMPSLHGKDTSASR